MSNRSRHLSPRSPSATVIVAVIAIAAAAITSALSGYDAAPPPESPGKSLAGGEEPPVAPRPPRRPRPVSPDLAQRQALEQAGWKPVHLADADRPNPDLADLNADAIARDTVGLWRQLQTVDYAGDSLDRVAEIARAAPENAHGEKTRHLAIEALGRSHDPRAQDLLVSLFEPLKHSHAARELILSLVQPRTPDGPVGEFLAAATADATLTSRERTQAAFALAAAAAARGENESRFLSRFSNTATSPALTGGREFALNAYRTLTHPLDQGGSTE